MFCAISSVVERLLHTGIRPFFRVFSRVFRRLQTPINAGSTGESCFSRDFQILPVFTVQGYKIGLQRSANPLSVVERLLRKKNCSSSLSGFDYLNSQDSHFWNFENLVFGSRGFYFGAFGLLWVNEAVDFLLYGAWSLAPRMWRRLRL